DAGKKMAKTLTRSKMKNLSGLMLAIRLVGQLVWSWFSLHCFQEVNGWILELEEVERRSFRHSKPKKPVL
ncbi:MAG: hypothetical protein AAF518_13495, partial [Spirochaetota bacterium]